MACPGPQSQVKVIKSSIDLTPPSGNLLSKTSKTPLSTHLFRSPVVISTRLWRLVMSVLYLSNIVVNRFLIKDISSPLVSAQSATLILLLKKNKVTRNHRHLKTESTTRTRTTIDVLTFFIFFMFIFSNEDSLSFKVT